MNGINPLWITGLTFLITVQTGIGTKNVSLDHVFTPDVIPWVQGWCGFLAFIGGGLVTALTTIQSATPGIFIRKPDAAKAAAFVFLAVGLLFAMPGDAHAQGRGMPRVAAPASGPVLTGDLAADVKNGFKGDPNNPNAGIKLTGDLKTDALAVWKQIQGASHDDLAYASLMAGAAGTPAAKTRKQCWDAIVQVNEQSNGNNLKNSDGTPATKPDPSLFTDIETAAEIIDNLSPQGELYTSCSGAAQLFQANVIQFISAAVTGVTGLAKLKPIPGL